MNSSQVAEHVLLIIDNREFMDLIYNVRNVIVFVSTVYYTLAVLIVVFKNFIY